MLQTASLQSRHLTMLASRRQQALLLHQLRRHLQKIENQIRTLIQQDQDLSHKAKALQQITAVGEKIAVTLLSEMPEPGTLNRQQAASLAGVASSLPVSVNAANPPKSP